VRLQDQRWELAMRVGRSLCFIAAGYAERLVGGRRHRYRPGGHTGERGKPAHRQRLEVVYGESGGAAGICTGWHSTRLSHAEDRYAGEEETAN